MILKLKRYLLLYFSKQFLYFILAGTSAAFVNWSTRILFRYYFNFLVSAILAYSLALVFAFLLYRNLVFPYSTLPVDKQTTRFLLINISFMPIVLWVFNYLSILLKNQGVGNFSEPVAHAISIGMPAFITFLLYKFIAFKRDNSLLD